MERNKNACLFVVKKFEYELDYRCGGVCQNNHEGINDYRVETIYQYILGNVGSNLHGLQMEVG